MPGVELLARGGVRLHGLIRLGYGPEVLLQVPAAIARVAQDGDAREVDGALPVRVVPAVLHVDDHATRRLVDGVPFVDRVELGILRHDRLDPRPDRLASTEIAEDVLDVVCVLREEIRPRVPVLSDRTGPPVRAKRVMQLVAGKRHVWYPPSSSCPPADEQY